jgi:hypothetical protein
MEACVEARDLPNVGHALEQLRDAGQVVRLVQRRERLELAQVVEHARRDDDRRRIARAAVDDAVADAGEGGAGEPRAQPRRQCVERRACVGCAGNRVGRDGLAGAVLRL